MKRIFFIPFAILALVCCTLQIEAQTKNKFGHVNSQQLLELMPERLTAEKELQTFADQLEAQLKTMSTEWETKINDYRANQSVMSDIIRQTKEEEIANLEQRIQAFQQNAQQSLAQKENELIEPILDKAKKAIEEVATENGYTYVFDASSGALLFQPESDDILPLVKKKMGLE